MENEIRLIDANALLKAIESEYDLNYGEIPLDPIKFADMVKDAPTIDAVPVVRCKDCKHREKSPWCDGYRCGNPYDGMASGVELKDDDFCSYGERRTEE